MADKGQKSEIMRMTKLGWENGKKVILVEDIIGTEEERNTLYKFVTKAASAFPSHSYYNCLVRVAIFYIPLSSRVRLA